MRGMHITQLSELLSSFDEVEFAYLFGSYVAGDISKHSDVDVAVYVKAGYDTFDVGLKVHHKLEVMLKKDVDVVVLNDVKNYRLLKDIISKGIVLKDGENRLMFEVKKQHEIIDYFDFKRMIYAS
jgi:predicted nucleotidyltransferase